MADEMMGGLWVLASCRARWWVTLVAPGLLLGVTEGMEVSHVLDNIFPVRVYARNPGSANVTAAAAEGYRARVSDKRAVNKDRDTQMSTAK